MSSPIPARRRPRNSSRSEIRFQVSATTLGLRRRSPRRATSRRNPMETAETIAAISSSFEGGRSGTESMLPGPNAASRPASRSASARGGKTSSATATSRFTLVNVSLITGASSSQRARGCDPAGDPASKRTRSTSASWRIDSAAPKRRRFTRSRRAGGNRAARSRSRSSTSRAAASSGGRIPTGIDGLLAHGGSGRRDEIGAQQKGRACSVPWNTPRNQRACAMGRLGGFLEVRQVPAEEAAGALLHLPDALAGQAPLLAEVLESARILLREPVVQDVPGQLAHPLADPAERAADVLLPLGADDLLVGRRAVVLETVEVGRLPFGIERLLERDVARGQSAVGHRPAHRRRTVLQRASDVGADPPHRVRGEAIALLRVEVLDGLQEAIVALLHEILEADAAAHEFAGHGDDEAQVVQDELLLRALLALARLSRDHELHLPIERGVGPDQLDQGREIVELAAVAHSLCSVLSLPSQRPAAAKDPDRRQLASDHVSSDAERRTVLLIPVRGVMTHGSSATSLASTA